MFVVCGTNWKVLTIEVMCDQFSTMLEGEGSSSNVRVFMTENEALWYEFEYGFS